MVIELEIEPKQSERETEMKTKINRKQEKIFFVQFHQFAIKFYIFNKLYTLMGRFFSYFVAQVSNGSHRHHQRICVHTRTVESRVQC